MNETTISDRNSYVDIDVLVMTHHVIHITAVHLRHLSITAVIHHYLTKSHSTGLDNEVIDRHLDRLVRSSGIADLDNILIQTGTELDQIQ